MMNPKPFIATSCRIYQAITDKNICINVISEVTTLIAETDYIFYLRICTFNSAQNI